LILGRSLGADAARAGHEGVVIDQRLATLFFPDQSPIGKRIQLTTTAGPETRTPWLTVVGVTSTLPAFGAAGIGGPRPVAYLPLALDAGVRSVTLVVRHRRDLEQTVRDMRGDVRALDADVPLFAVQTMDTALAFTRWPIRLLGTWASTLALIALVVATVGLFALTAHAVTQRRQEIGVRLALGAPPRDVVWGVMRRTVVQLALGLSLGLALAIVAAPQLQVFLGPMSSRDPLTLTLVSGLLVVIALVATLLPARRAARIDPALTLRAE
jgi:putative ABC transport system permease protein